MFNRLSYQNVKAMSKNTCSFYLSGDNKVSSAW